MKPTLKLHDPLPHSLGATFFLEPGNGSRLDCFYLWVQGTLYFAVEGRGAYHFWNEVSREYIGEKLGLSRYPGDALALACFLNRQLAPGRAPAPDYTGLHGTEHAVALTLLQRGQQPPTAFPWGNANVADLA